METQGNKKTIRVKVINHQNPNAEEVIKDIDVRYVKTLDSFVIFEEFNSNSVRIGFVLCFSLYDVDEEYMHKYGALRFSRLDYFLFDSAKTQKDINTKLQERLKEFNRGNPDNK